MAEGATGGDAAPFAVVLEECLSRMDPERDRARRLFHGRGRCFPGFEDLTVDRHGTSVLVACHSADGLERAEALARMLLRSLDGIEGACVQHRTGSGTRSAVVAGEVAEEIVIREDGLKFLIRPLGNQNVGLFLDMAPTRSWLAANAAGARVLNLFAFTCAFSVAALAGGAAHVVNNDMSRRALDWGRENHAQNGQDPRLVSMLPHNLFRSWWKIRQLGPYDLVIVDPPTSQRGSFVAEKHYPQVLKRLPELCSPGAKVITCLNSPFLERDFLLAEMAARCPAARFETFMPVSEDFPDRQPERALKIARFRYQP